MRAAPLLKALALLAIALPLCLSQFPFTSGESPAATVISLQGSVSVLKDSSQWALTMGDQIAPQQVVVSGPDGYAAFRVADGSTFEVFPNSRITFRANSGNWRDMVDVWLGRIRVHIQKLGGQPNPNRVHTPTAIISVRGTIFDVSVEDGDETTRVAVEEGQVAVEHRLMPRDGDPKILNSGDELVVYRNSPLSAGRRVDRGRVMQYVADAIWQILVRTPRLPGGTTTGGPTPTVTGAPVPPPTTLPGDTGATPPPPAPPPAPGGPH